MRPRPGRACGLRCPQRLEVGLVLPPLPLCLPLCLSAVTLLCLTIAWMQRSVQWAGLWAVDVAARGWGGLRRPGLAGGQVCGQVCPLRG